MTVRSRLPPSSILRLAGTFKGLEQLPMEHVKVIPSTVSNLSFITKYLTQKNIVTPKGRADHQPFFGPITI
jgi:hypothetical protein